MKHSEEDNYKKIFRSKINDNSSPSPEDEELWKKILQGINKEPVREKKYADLQWYASAAAVLLFLTVAFGIFYYKSSQNENNLAYKYKIESTKIDSTINKNTQETILKEIENSPNEIASQKPTFASAKAIKANNKIIKEHLTDGSLITLNKGASIKVETGFNNQRNVLLEEGEAYFEVNPDSQKVFTVYFGEVKLTVLGTKFNIRNHRKEKLKEVTVTEGRVMVWVDEQEGIELKKGDQLKLTGKNKSSRRKVDAANFIKWKTGNLNFKNIKLEELVTIFNRQYSADISLSRTLHNCRITGDFTGLSLDEALKVISLTTSVKVIKSGNNKVELTGENCE